MLPGGMRHLLFVLFLAFLAISVASTTPFVGLGEGFLLSFDAAAFLFITGTSLSMARASPASLRRNAARNDAGRVLLLVIVALLLAVSLVALGLELARAGRPDGMEVLLVVLTLGLA